jgi:WD40 repeat protein
MGTPSYMAPEQAEGRTNEIGPAADIYALGSMLYECLTGRPPFKAATLADTLQQVVREEPVTPRRLNGRVPRDLETVCLKCLQKAPSRRYATAGALAEDLRRFRDGEPILARPVGWGERTWRWCRRNPRVAGLLGLVAVLIVVGIVGTVTALVLIDRARHQAQENALREAEARGRAERSAEESRRRLIRLHLATGTSAVEADDRASALCWYLHAWQMDRPGDDAEEDHRLRLASLLAEGPQLVGVGFHRRPVQDAVFDPTGRRVLTTVSTTTSSGGHAAYVWDIGTSRLAIPPLRHQAPIRHACFNSDGSLIATASEDRTARIWDAATGKLLHTLSNNAPVNWLAFRPGHPVLITASAKGLSEWNTKTGTHTIREFGPKDEVWYLAFSDDGSRLVTAGADHRAAVWDMDSGRALTPPLLHRALNRNEAYFRYKRWPILSPDGKLLVTAADGDLHFWDVETGNRRGQPLPGTAEVLHLAFSRDGGRLLVHHDGSIALVYRVEDGKKLLTLRHPRSSQYGTFSPDGQLILTVSSGGVVHLWDANTGKPIEQPLRCADFVRRVAFSPDGRRFLAASQDGTVRVWSLAEPSPGVRPYDFDCGRADQLILETADGKRCYSPDGRRECRFDRAETCLRDRQGDDAGVKLDLPASSRTARFSPDGRRLFATTADSIFCFDATTGQRVGVTLHAAPSEISGDGGRLISLDDPRTFTVRDIDRRPVVVFGPIHDPNRFPLRFGPPTNHGKLGQPRLTPDGRTALVGIDSSGAVAAWDVDSGKELFQSRLYSGYLYDLDISDDGTSFLIASSDTIARLYRTRDGQPLGPPLRHPSSVEKGAIAPGGVRVATRDRDGVLRVWDGQTGDELARLASPDKVRAVWFSRDGKRGLLASGERAWQWRLPRLELDTRHWEPLTRLLTGRLIDASDTLGLLDQQTFLDDPTPYRRAWLAWRGLEDDPAAQPGDDK